LKNIRRVDHPGQFLREMPANIFQSPPDGR
jgi:hypothetical protein